jgi:hypothetical protein
MTRVVRIGAPFSESCGFTPVRDGTATQILALPGRR